MIRIHAFAPPASGPVPRLAVLRSPADPELWAVHSVDPAGGVGPRCSALLASREAAEALAHALGVLTEPFDEAA